MLRRLDVKEPWRSLTPGFWPPEVPLGRATVIYGHNGSGKSTLAEALLSVAAADAATAMTWEQDDKRKVAVAAGAGGPSPAMAVFTRKWVEANLSEFLDGENADAIVTLGEAAIDAKERERQLVEEIDRLREEAKKATETQRRADKRVESLAREVQDRLVTELQRVDYSHFTKNRYTVNKVKALLREPRSEFPSAADHAEAFQRLGQPASTPVEAIRDEPASLYDELKALAQLLSRTPDRVALAALEADAQAQAWVEAGRPLHRDEVTCLFCCNEISTARREELARHFDDSWRRIRGEAERLHSAVAALRSDLGSWLASFPDAAALSGEESPREWWGLRAGGEA